MAKGKKRSKWKFTAREIRAVVALIPLIAVLVWIIWSASRPRFDRSATILGDTLIENPASPSSNTPTTVSTENTSTASPQENIPETPALFQFDPNTVTYEELRSLGVAKSTAAGIVKYRERGKVFQIPEDFATCYGITDSAYAVIKPYIAIAEQFCLKPASRPAAPSEKEPEAALSEATGSETTRIEFSIRKVELNTADSAELTSVRGIGPKTASEIIRYRERLGGFHSPEQIAEIRVVNEKNYEMMLPEIWADSCEIQKIDINFASPNAVADHPYMAGKKARKILKNRQLRGGWSTIREMIDDHTLTTDEARRLAPYLLFTREEQ